MMVKRIKSNRIITDNGLFDGYIYFESGLITAVTESELPYDVQYDYTDLYVSCGFIDIHTHGAAGHGFVNCNKEDVLLGASYHLTHGTTSIVPTISAAPFPVMRDAVGAISDAMKSKESVCNIIGAHMEGPYLSKEQCGAQCPDFITEPVKADYEALISAYPGVIKRWTFAPESDRGGSFCKYLTEHNIIASVGHSNATGDECETAFENGANLITHLYSCTSTVTRDHGFRRLGVIEEAYLHSDVFAEIIADGKHLPPDLIKLILKIKGTDRVALITDSLSVTGTDVLSGEMSGTKFIIEDGVCKLTDRSAFAGSIATADRLVRVLTKDVGVPVFEAVKMITKVPGEILCLNKGRMAAGYDADINVFDDNIDIKETFVGGDKVQGN